MNDNNDIEKEISRVISGKIYEPKEYKIAIEKALYANDKKMKNTYVYKMIAAICCSLILLSGIVYASYSIIQNVFNNRKGIDTAISNNYIMDGLESYQESNGIAVKINNMLIDDYNLDISFNVKFDEKIKTEDIKSLKFEKMIIIDEKNRILFNTGKKEVLTNFLTSNSLDIKIDEFGENNINSSYGYKIENNQNNQVNLIYNLSSFDNEYPKSKQIIIYAENIIINNNENIKGTWQIKQTIDSKFYSREKIEYKYEDNDEKNIVNVNATTYATGTNISIEIEMEEMLNNRKDIESILNDIEIELNDEIIGSNDSKINALRDELFSASTDMSEVFTDIYIENTNKVKFYPTDSVNENEKMLKLEKSETIQYSSIIDMTIYDCTDEITLHFIHNEDEYNIKLKNKKGQ